MMLSVENLNAYYGQAHVLKDVSIRVNKGEVVVMLGPNGHGKSTLLKSIWHGRFQAGPNILQGPGYY